MTRQIGPLGMIIATTVVILGAAERPASAAPRAFAAHSIIIPMDTCYQPTNGLGATPAPGYCPDPVGTANDGVTKAYGLVYRLLQKGVKVYYAVDSTKTTPGAVDFTITAPSGTPMALFDRSVGGGGTREFMSASHTSISYRGAPFVIDAADYATVAALLITDSVNAPVFASVNLHVAKQGFTAPITAVLNQTPPKVALLNIGGAAISVLEGYLIDAGLFNGTAVTAYPGIGDVFTEFDNVSDFTSNGLITGGFKVLWAPHWEGDLMPVTQRNQVVQAISDFVDKGNSFFAECAAISTIEGATSSYSAWNQTPASPGNFMVSVGAGSAGLLTDQIPQPSWPTGRAGEGIVVNPSAAGGVLTQIGDFQLAIKTLSFTFDFVPDPAHGASYKAGVTRLFTTIAPASEVAYANRDLATMFHKDNDPKKGIILYLGGHDHSGVAGGTAAIAVERLVLNSLLFLGTLPSSAELARSSPVLTADGKSYQGTYVDQTSSAAAYPPWQGHFREYPAGAVSGTAAFNKITANWDAAGGIPAAGSRTVFTAVPVSGKLTKTPFTTANAAALSGPMGMSGAAQTAAINGILAGGLGGIDHSTPAVIGPSAIAGSSTRPTVAYVGALDGMLHAIAVSGSGVTAGAELWAFIPPSQLSTIGKYLAGVDGSPQVADAFVDTAGTGLRSWHTLLTVTNGAFGGTVDTLDITDPLHPAYLWTGATAAGTYAMGAASGAAFGTISSNSAPRDIVYLATNNAGTGGSGFNLYALDAGNGAIVWQWNRKYVRHIPSTALLVPNDVPGVPALRDTAGDGGLDDRLFFGDLDGYVWAINPATGAPPAAALYDAGTDGYPFSASVSLYRTPGSQHLGVIGATGGSDWVPATITSFVVAVDSQSFVSGNSGAGVVLFKTALALGERVYAPPTVAGDDVYLVTSFGALGGNIGSTVADAGNLRRVNLVAGSVTLTSAIKKGAGAAALASDGSIIAASANGENRIANTGRDASTTALDFQSRPMVVQAWLDLH